MRKHNNTLDTLYARFRQMHYLKSFQYFCFKWKEFVLKETNMYDYIKKNVIMMKEIFYYWSRSICTWKDNNLTKKQNKKCLPLSALSLIKKIVNINAAQSSLYKNNQIDSFAFLILFTQLRNPTYNQNIVTPPFMLPAHTFDDGNFSYFFYWSTFILNKKKDNTEQHQQAKLRNKMWDTLNNFFYLK